MFNFNRSIHTIVLLYLLSGAGIASAADNTVLTLSEAESLALAVDPGSKRFRSLSSALQEKAVADAQLPDPQLRLGLLNFPVDTFNRDQEPMTQIQLGVQQMFPRGDSLEIKSRQAQVDAMTQDYRADNRERMLSKQVRLKWLELFYWLRAEAVISKNRGLFQQLVEVTQYQYGSGRRNQQDVIRAQLELSRLDDRLTDIQSRQDRLRAELGVLIGRPAASIRLPETLPELAKDLDQSLALLEKTLNEHPLMRVAQSQVESGQQDVALAREDYKPGWMLGVNYGIRDGQNPNGSDRADFFSVGVTVDVPLFRDKRQDRRLQSSQHKLGASKHMLDQQYLELRQMLDSDYAEWQRLQERYASYRDSLIPQARQNAETTLFAYQSDRADFSALVRARITELETELKATRIQVDLVKAQARVLYLTGETS